MLFLNNKLLLKKTGIKREIIFSKANSTKLYFSEILIYEN